MTNTKQALSTQEAIPLLCALISIFISACNPSGTIQKRVVVDYKDENKNGVAKTNNPNDRDYTYCQDLSLAGNTDPSYDKFYKSSDIFEPEGFSLTSSHTLANYRTEYLALWNSIKLKADKITEIDRHIKKLLEGKSRYKEVGIQTKVPWWWIGLTHGLEGSYDFSTHLHNGDSLKARTVHVPAGRPKTGSAPFKWETSAVDALNIDRINRVKNWGDIAEIAFIFETYNGFGYRNRKINSPYLWSYSNQYTAGKYVADGLFSASAISKQAGAMSILKRLVDKKIVTLSATTQTTNDTSIDTSPCGY